jgi:hypothetical protein
MSAVHYDVVGKLESGMNATLGMLLDKLGIDAAHYQHSGRNSHDAHAKLKMHYQVISAQQLRREGSSVLFSKTHRPQNVF